jgi:acid phosphatase
MMKRTFQYFILILLVLFTSVILAAPSKVSYQAAPNMPNYLQYLFELKYYYHTGQYSKGINKVAVAAKQYLNKRVKASNGKKIAAVFDIDETLLSNVPYLDKKHFRFSYRGLTNWMKRGQDARIEPTYALYKDALREGVKVFLITGRREYLRKITIKNLKAQGINQWQALYMFPNKAPFTENSATFKQKIREKLAKQGYDIVLNIGDQYSDLCGGYADTTFKLPNPFYYSPGCSARYVCRQLPSNKNYGGAWHGKCLMIYSLLANKVREYKKKNSR